MATTGNVIEVLIRSVVSGQTDLVAFRRQLEAMIASAKGAQRVFLEGVLSGMEAELKTAATASAGTTKAIDNLSTSAKGLTTNKLGLNRALGLVLSSLGGMGPAGTIASNALLAVAVGAGALGAAIGVASTAIALLVSHLQSAREEKERLDLAFASGDIGAFSAAIFKTNQELRKVDEQIDKTRRKIAESQAAPVTGGRLTEGIRQSFGASQQAGQEGLQRQLNDLELKRNELIEQRQTLVSNEANTTITALQAQTAAIGASAIEQEELSHQMRLAAGYAGELKGATEDQIKAFERASEQRRDAKIAEILKREAEETRKKSQAEIAAIESARASLQGQIDAENLLIKAQKEGEEAAILYGIALLSESKAVKTLKEEGDRLLKILRDTRLERLKNKNDAEAEAQARKNRVTGLQAELTALEELRQHDANRAIAVDELTANYNNQAEAIRRATEISIIGDEDTRRVLELTTAYDTQVRALENLITKYPEAEAAIRSLIDAMGGQLKVNIQTTTEQLGNLQQSLTDVFASSIDRSFDALLDRTRSFGDRMTGLMEGIGETIFKTILHHAITIPLQSGLAELFKTINSLAQGSGGGGGGGFGGFLGLIGSIAGLFGGGATGQFTGGATGYEASFFANGGLVLAGAGGKVPSSFLTNRYNIPRLAQGAVVRGPTLAVLGEGGEDEFVIPRSKMKNMQNGGGQTSVKVEINGDITPRQPNMKPEDVIKVVIDDGLRSDRGGIGGMIKSVIKRNR